MENKIIYVHGLSSSGATASAQNIQALLPQYQVVAPDMPLPPQQALQLLTDLVAELQPVLVVGTSMGAMFTQQLHGQTKILINPAFHVSQLMRK
ncbi:YqiA/YcfP family alpha/beta fold hydrolase, partial [Bacteroides sp.]